MLVVDDEQISRSSISENSWGLNVSDNTHGAATDSVFSGNSQIGVEVWTGHDNTEPDFTLERCTLAQNGRGISAGFSEQVGGVSRGTLRIAHNQIFANDLGVFEYADGRIMTLPIVGRALYETLGYVYHPAYISMFCDDDLTHTAAAMGRLVDARHLEFPHRHFSVGSSAPDATYARQNSNAAWWHGWRVLEKRRANGFGLGARTLAVRAKEVEVDVRYFVRIYGSRVKRLLARRA